MRSDWKEYQLEDIIEKFIDYRGKTPKKTNSGVPLITAKIVKNGRVEPFQEYIAEEDYDSWMTRGIPKKGAVIITTEAPMGEVAQLLSNEKVAFAQRVIVVEGKKDIVDNTFLKYLFQSPLFQHKLREKETGTTVTGIKSKELKKIKVEIPQNIVDQKKIAFILNSLDSKIEHNNQMIATLEELAVALFKRWFVDFEFPDENGDPYKSSGGKMVESELGEVPEGWRLGTLSDLGDIVGGGTPSKKKDEYYDNGSISWITPKDLSEQKNVYVRKGKLNITELGLSKSSAKLMPVNSILFSSRAPVGYIAITDNEVSTNQGFKSIVPKCSGQSVFIYLLLKSEVRNIENMATGSTFKEVSGTLMKNFKIRIPENRIINSFSEIVSSWFGEIKSLEKEIDNLINLRDSFLPRFLSGEMEI